MLDPKHNKKPHSDFNTWFNEYADQDKAMYQACGLPANKFWSLRESFKTAWSSTNHSHPQNFSSAFIRYCINAYLLNPDTTIQTVFCTNSSTDMTIQIDKPFSEDSHDWSISEEDLESLGWKTGK